MWEMDGRWVGKEETDTDTRMDFFGGLFFLEYKINILS